MDALLGVTQPLGGIQIIVVDDASEDGTAELARERLGDQGKVLSREGPRSLAR